MHLRRTLPLITTARFPFQKTLETFDWKFQPCDPKVIKELATGWFLTDGENVLLLAGSLGRGTR